MRGSELTLRLQRHPTDLELIGLRREVAEGMRRQEIKRFVHAVEEVEAKGEWAQVEAMLVSGQRSFPDEPALAELRDRIARRRVELMHFAPMVRERIAAGDFAAAERLLSETKGQLSDDATWSALSAELRERKERRREELPKAESGFAGGSGLETGDDRLEEMLKKYPALSAGEPTAAPAARPTPQPTAVPTPPPTAVPTPPPTAVPTSPPTAAPGGFWRGAPAKAAAQSGRPHVVDERQMLIPPAVSIDNVHFTLTAPGMLERGAASEIQFWVHVEKQRQTVLERAREAQGPEALGMIVRSDGPFLLQRGARLSVRIRVDGLKYGDDQKWVVWTGDIGSVNFVVTVPADAAEGTHVGSASIRLNGCQIAKMSFVLRVGEKRVASAVVPAEIETHRRAFASYASEDRSEVLARVQGMEAAYRGLKVFVDAIDLRSGDRWEAELPKRIADADVFYLFWCRHAEASAWVSKEWHWALQAKGLDFIDPVPLEDPRNARPPSELAAKHFNDPLLAFIEAAGKNKHS